MVNQQFLDAMTECVFLQFERGSSKQLWPPGDRDARYYLWPKRGIPFKDSARLMTLKLDLRLHASLTYDALNSSATSPCKSPLPNFAFQI